MPVWDPKPRASARQRNVPEVTYGSQKTGICHLLVMAGFQVTECILLKIAPQVKLKETQLYAIFAL
jgi:hypothetical protein